MENRLKGYILQYQLNTPFASRNLAEFVQGEYGTKFVIVRVEGIAVTILARGESFPDDETFSTFCQMLYAYCRGWVHAYLLYT